MSPSASRQSRPAWSVQAIGHVIRRSLLPLGIATIVGAAAGVVVSDADSQFKATVVLSVRSGSDVGTTDTLVASAASSVLAPVVISAAASSLKLDPAVLAARTSAVVESGTTLIDVTVSGPSQQDAIARATTVSDQTLQNYRDRSAAIATQVRVAGENLLASGKLTAATAEAARQTSIGTVVGTAQGQSIEGAVTLSVVSPALGAVRAGISKPVGAVFGAAAGFLLMLLALLSGALRRRRRIRTAADLADVSGGIEVLREREIDQVAGAVLESGRRCIVVLGDGPTVRPRMEVASSLEQSLVRSGLSVGRVEVGGSVDEGAGLTFLGGGLWAVGERQASDVLARASRSRLPQTLETDLVLIELDSRQKSAGLLHGQRDFLPIVSVARGSTVGEFERLIEPFAGADPVVVLSGS